jgi:hypothetical protein
MRAIEYLELSSLIVINSTSGKSVMKCTRCGFALAVPILAALLLLPCYAFAESIGVYELTQQGWQIVQQSERQEEQAGQAPYENLTRVLFITEYDLVKVDQTMRCRIIYDSQTDTQTEECQRL